MAIKSPFYIEMINIERDGVTYYFDILLKYDANGRCNVLDEAMTTLLI